MADLVLIQSDNGDLQVRPCYFGNSKYGHLLNGDRQRVGFERAKFISVLAFERHGQVSLKKVTPYHLAVNGTDFATATPTIAADKRSFTTVRDLFIDGLVTWRGDQIEVPPSVATAAGIAPGIWRTDSDRSFSLIAPVTYTLQSNANLGGSFQYREVSAGVYSGVVGFVPTGQTFTQNVPSAAVTQLARFLDGSPNTYVSMASASTQGFTVNFPRVDNVRRLVMRATAIKTSYDTTFPSATFGINIAGSPLGTSFTNASTGVRPWAGAYTWSRGAVETWVTGTIDRSISTFTLNDSAASRAYVSMEMFIDGACQIRVGNEVPPAGANLVISSAVGDTFFPKIPGGTYTVEENSGTVAWRMKKQ